MNVKRYFAATARDALRSLKEELGPEAIVLSNRSVDGGVEITAVAAGEIVHSAAPERVRPPQEDEDFTVSLSAGRRQPAPRSSGRRPRWTASWRANWRRSRVSSSSS